MYEHALGLSCQPFGMVPDPRFLFLPLRLEAEFRRLLDIARGGQGILLLTGEVGTGKTLLARTALQQLGDDLNVLVMEEPGASTEHIRTFLGNQLGLGEQAPTFETLAGCLRKKLKSGQHFLLVVDEAQHLSVESLEYLRLLGNIEDDARKAMSLLLIGQPELTVRLSRPDLRQLAQRVLFHLHLTPLSEAETRDYILHRFMMAGGDDDWFAPRVFGDIYRETGGNARLINRLMAQVLYQLAQDETARIDIAEIRAASRVLSLQRGAAGSPSAAGGRVATGVAGAGLAALLFIGAGVVDWQQPQALVRAWLSPAVVSAAPAMVEQAQDDAHTALPAREVASNDEELSAAESALGNAAIDAVQQMLWLWQRERQGAGELCDQAAQHGLACLHIEQPGLERLLAYNRPALVATSRGDRVLIGADATRVWLLDAHSRTYQLERAAFLEQWTGSARILWRPPAGYGMPMKTGDQSFPLVFWLQDAMNKLGRVQGRIITGGYYTEALAGMVRDFQGEVNLAADGVLGPQTIMAINERLDETVPRLNAGQGELAAGLMASQ